MFRKYAVAAALIGLAFSAAVVKADQAAADNFHLASVNAAVAYVDSDTLLQDKNADRSVPIASLTKLMTALVVMDSGEPLNEWLEVLPRHKDAPNNAYSRIRIGSELRRSDMLRIALMSSENLAAYTLARHHPGGYNAFIADMNKKALTLGMTNSVFVDPTGLSESNRASASDIVKLVRASIKHPQIGDYSTTRYYSARFRQPRYSLSYGNTNALVHRDSWGVGLSKTGYLTEAGRCLAMVSKIDGKEVITVFLDSFGTRSPMGDAGRVKRWLSTGDSGKVAGAAKRYEQEKNAQYAKGSESIQATN